MLGETLPPRSYQRNLEELDALLGSVGSMGFGLLGEDGKMTDAEGNVIEDDSDDDVDAESDDE